MKTGAKIAIIVPSVLVVGAVTFFVVISIQNKNKNKVSDTEWKDTFSKIVDSDSRSFHSLITKSDGSNVHLTVIGQKEEYNSTSTLRKGYDEYKYKKNNKAYFWDTTISEENKWKETEKMFSEDTTICGLSYLSGIIDKKDQFTYSDDKYKGKLNNADIVISFGSDKILSEIEFTIDSTSNNSKIAMSFENLGKAQFNSEFPAAEPVAF